MMFHEGEKVREEQRFLLELYGLFLSRMQGKSPKTGIIWYSHDPKGTRVLMNRDVR